MSIQEKIRYGAAELKRVYNRNLGMALTISIGVHLLLIGLYAFGQNMGKADEEQKRRLGAKTKLINIAPPPEAAANEPPPIVPPELVNPAGGGGVAARAGNPVPVPDAVIAPDVKDFATIEEVTVATPQGGDGTGFRAGQDVQIGSPIDLGAKVDVKEQEPDPDEFVPDATDPTLDYDALKKRVRYPEIAKKNGIEGTVVVRVLVDRFGKPQKYRIDHSDNKLLDQSAIDAVMSTQFTPGVQNGVPIQLWVTVPIKFELE